MGDINHVWNCQHIFEMDLLRRKLKEREDEIEGLKRELGRIRAMSLETRPIASRRQHPRAAGEAQ